MVMHYMLHIAFHEYLSEKNFYIPIKCSASHIFYSAERNDTVVKHEFEIVQDLSQRFLFLLGVIPTIFYNSISIEQKNVRTLNIRNDLKLRLYGFNQWIVGFKIEE